MSEQSERNKTLVLEYMAAFRTFDPDVYFPYLADEPVYMAGMNVRRGPCRVQGEHRCRPHPLPGPRVGDQRAPRGGGRGDWVAVLLKRRARTNKVDDYENLYGMFYEVVDGRIQTQVELLDFRVAQEQFDLSALTPPSGGASPSSGRSCRSRSAPG